MQFLCPTRKGLNLLRLSHDIIKHRRGKSLLSSTQREVWRHVSIVAKFLHFNNLFWQRQPFSLSSYRFVPECNLSCTGKSLMSIFFLQYLQDHGLWDSEMDTMATWRNDSSPLYYALSMLIKQNAMYDVSKKSALLKYHNTL